MYSNARYLRDRKGAKKTLKAAGQKCLKNFSLVRPFSSMGDLMWLIAHVIVYFVRIGFYRLRLALK